MRGHYEPGYQPGCERGRGPPQRPAFPQRLSQHAPIGRATQPPRLRHPRLLSPGRLARADARPGRLWNGRICRIPVQPKTCAENARPRPRPVVIRPATAILRVCPGWVSGCPGHLARVFVDARARRQRPPTGKPPAACDGRSQSGQTARGVSGRAASHWRCAARPSRSPIVDSPPGRKPAGIGPGDQPVGRERA